MEKNKNRGDLIAAGRKKFLQYRQKKDKGSKTSAKSGKSEPDTGDESGSAAVEPKEISVQAHDQEVGSLHDSKIGVIDSSASHSVENIGDSSSDAVNVGDPIQVPTVPTTDNVEMTITGTDELPPEVSGGTEAVGVSFSEAIQTVVSQGESRHLTMHIPIDSSAPIDILNANELVASAIEPDNLQGGDQVADEDDLRGPEQIDQNSGIELGGALTLDLSENASSHPGRGAGDTDMKEAILNPEHTDKLGAVSASAGAMCVEQDTGEHSVSPQPLLVLDDSSVASPEVRNQQRDDAVSNSTYEGKIEMPSIVDYGSSNHAEGMEADTAVKTFDNQGFLESHIHSQKQPLETKTLNLLSGTNAGLISLSQLAEVLRDLEEDEFNFLLLSRGSRSNTNSRNTGCLSLPHHDLSDLMEKLKEQLCLTNLAKDVEQFELETESRYQHQQLLEELSYARASLYEFQGRNKSLSEELAECRSELQSVDLAREEIQTQVYSANNEVKELSARSDELHIELERSQGDLLRLSSELADCKDLVAALQVKNESLVESLSSVSEEKEKLIEDKINLVFEGEKLMSELSDCKDSLLSLQMENVNLNNSLALHTEARQRLEDEQLSIVQENQNHFIELVNCQVLLEVFQHENENLNRAVTLMTSEMKNIEEEKEYFARESEKLSMELDGRISLIMKETEKLGEEKEHVVREKEELTTKLVDCEDLIAGLRVENIKAMGDLKEATMQIEQLSEENVFLKSSLDMQKAKLMEFDNGRGGFLSQSGEAGSEVKGSDTPSREQVTETDFESHQNPSDGGREILSREFKKSLSDGVGIDSPLKQLEMDVYADSSGFLSLEGHLKEAEKIIRKVENEIEGLQSHSASLSRPSSKVVKPAVSKLIQAFESKSHPDGQEAVEVPSTENQSFLDRFNLTKQELGNLKSVLKELGLDAVNANELFKGERDGRALADTGFRELTVTYEFLQKYCDSMEAANIELVILYEVMNQHMRETEAKNVDLLSGYEALWRQNNTLKVENDGLGRILNANESCIDGLQKRLDAIHSSADETASSLYSQVENLHKDVIERQSILELNWNFTVAQVVRALEKLDTSIERIDSTVKTGGHDGQDIGSSVAGSVDVATKVIEDLEGKLQAARLENEVLSSSYTETTEKLNYLHSNNELATNLFQEVYSNLRKLLYDSTGDDQQADANLQNEELLKPVDPSNFDSLVERLRKLLGERIQLKFTNSELSSELRDRVKDIEELNQRRVDLNAVLKLVEDVEGLHELEGTSIKSDEPSACLESLISILVHKYKEADKQINLLRESFGCKEMEIPKLKEHIDQLNFLILQLENEILILKESLRQAEEDLGTVHTELQEKVAELEQSEHRVSSLREKLGIAVSKGKGLILQRDGLKQSLAEMSSELEKCSHELELKEAQIHEVEAKLKIYSEAGERVEALESELSYIRNSATSLRESFLLKDSVLQSIEEILEDLELPEQFHSRDIVEKVEWLARSLSGNSLHVNDLDQNSYSDTGLKVMDSWKEEPLPNSNLEDDLTWKYEELQSKLYGLAEQNEMLEQSLVERNKLVQRWEEILDRINMPSHLRSVEPEDRIEWLGSALSDAHHHNSSLQQNIDNFVTHCASLTADLEASQKRISDLEEDFRAVTFEKEDLSEKLEISMEASQKRISDLEENFQAVTFEKEGLSEKMEILTREHDNVLKNNFKFEVENEKLQIEVRTLHEKLIEKVGTEEQISCIEGEIRRLQNLLIDVLQDTIGIEDVVSSSSNTECLEKLVMKLVDKYRTLSIGNPVVGAEVDKHSSEEANATKDIRGTREFRDTEEQDIKQLNKELEDALGDLISVKHDRDQCIQNNQSLVCQLEALDKEREELHKRLKLEEQKVDDALSDLISVKQERDQCIQNNQSLVCQVEALDKVREELQERLRLEEQKVDDALGDVFSVKQERDQCIQNNQSLVCQVETLDKEREELNERLRLEEQKVEDALGDLISVKQERDQCIQNNQSLVCQVEAFDKEKEALQERLRQEEQKVVSVREKLNVAVRKGKSLVQQRDSLKQNIEEVNKEVERLNSEIGHRESTLLEYEQKIKGLSVYQEKVEALESENLSLNKILVETENSLQEKGHTLSMFLKKLDCIDVGSEFNISDPVLKLEQIGKLCHDLRAAEVATEHDLKKSKRAAELLLTELNEVQEQNDGLQEELEKSASELSKLATERDLAEAAKHEALSHLQKLSAVHFEERSNQFSALTLLSSNLKQLAKSFFDINSLVDDVHSKYLRFLQNLAARGESCLQPDDSLYGVGLPLASDFGDIISTNTENKDNIFAPDVMLDPQIQQCFDDNSVIGVCTLVGNQVQLFMTHIGDLKEKVQTHLVSFCEEAKHLSEVVSEVHRESNLQKQSTESIKEKIIRLESNEKKKDTEIVVMRGNISMLYEACASSLTEIENWRIQLDGTGLADEDEGIKLRSPISLDSKHLLSGQNPLSSEECRTISDRLLSVVKKTIRMQAEIVDGSQKEMRTVILNLQNELQEKDIQRDRISVEFVNQIKEAEAASRGYLVDLQSAKALIHNLERKMEIMENERNILEQSVKELQDGKMALKQLQERERELNDSVASKEQEIEALMQALEEEEIQMEDQTNKIAELERVVLQKNSDLENLEATHGKTMRKLSVTVSKFDELHHLSAGLLSEIEKLQSQLQQRDEEISFLRQEVTRCTNDSLVASQMSSKRLSDENHDLLTWLNTMISRVQVHELGLEDKKSDQVQEFRKIIEKQISSIVSELEDLREVAQTKDSLLQVERNRVEELIRTKELLEKSLHEKEFQLRTHQSVGDSGQAPVTTTEIVEVEPVINNWVAAGKSVAPQVRSLRKVNNDQVAIAVDTDQGRDRRLEDEDDDKAHGFKSLSASRVVPGFTRPVTDLIDGLWVSCDRALMRRPAMRITLIIYWAVMHALLATFVV